MARKAASRKTAGAARKSSVKRKTGTGRAGAARKTGGRKTKTAARKKAAPRRPAASRRTSSRKTSRKTGARKARSGKTSARKTSGRKTSGRKTAKSARKASGRKTTGAAKAKPSGSRPAARKTSAARRSGTKAATGRPGGRGRERDLAQTPDAGRSVKGPTNPFPTKRSTGTPAGAGISRHAPDLDRARRHLREVEESIPGIPSSLDLDRRPSAARTGRAEMREARANHPEVSPEITGGDVDADWQGAYDSGDEAPGGDNMTPDQDRVDDIGKALGVQYEDNEELKGSDKIAERDKNRWELDPASSDDYKDRE